MTLQLLDLVIQLTHVQPHLAGALVHLVEDLDEGQSVEDRRKAEYLLLPIEINWQVLH